MPVPLWKRQTAMMMRQPAVRRGRPLQHKPWLKTESFIREDEIRTWMHAWWRAGKSEEEIAKHFERPVMWVRALVQNGFPLEP